MGARSRSFFLALLVPAVLLGGVFAVVQAQNAGAPAKATKWSDPATWPNSKVPAAGDKVTIAKGKNVILDVNPPALGGVTIDGKLSFADNADVELTTEWIMLHGELAIGTEAKPHTRKATITFTDTVKGENIMDSMGDRGIMMIGRHAQPARGSHQHLDQAVRDRRRRRHLDPGAGCRGLASRRRDRPRLDGLRSAPGRAAHDCRHQGQHDHARQEAGLHALRQDHLRRG